MKKREIAYPKKTGEQVVKYVTLKGELVDKLPKDEPVATIQITGDDPKAGEMHMLVSLPVNTKVWKPKKGDGGFSGKAAMIHKIVGAINSYRIVDITDIEELNENTMKLVFTVDKAVPETTPEALTEFKNGLKALLDHHNDALGGDPVDDADDDDDDNNTDDNDTDDDDDTDNNDTNDDDDNSDDDEPDPFADEDGEDEEEITLEPGKGVTGFQFTGDDEQVLNLQRSSADFYTKLQGICGKKTKVTLPNGEVYQSDSNNS